LLFVGAALADAFLTFFALWFVPGAQELNPLVRAHFIDPFGPAGVLAGKLVLVLLVGLLTAGVLRGSEALADRRAGAQRDVVALGLVITALIQGAVAASNLLVLVQAA
jgi:hypothetical protein